MYPDPVSARNTSYLIADLPGHERPRERLLRKGTAALSDVELLAILLRTGSRGRSALDLARDVLARVHGDLGNLQGLGVDELTELPGIGQAKAVQVKAALGLARRLAESTAGERPRLNSPQDVANLMREAFRGRCQEEFHALLLDTKNGLLRDECVTVGLLDRSQVHAREVFRTAIRESCSRILLCHNHPSGDPTPSVQDVSCTRSLAAAGKVVGIEILDHVVIGHRSSSCPTGFVSLREEGLFTES